MIGAMMLRGRRLDLRALVVKPLLESFDRFRFSVVAGVDQCSTESDVARGNVEVARLKRTGGLHDPPNVATDNAFVGATHAYVALKCRAAWQDARVCRWHMGMGA